MAERITENIIKLVEKTGNGQHASVEDLICDMIDSMEDNTKGVYIIMSPDRKTYTLNYCGMDKIELMGLLALVQQREAYD